MGHCCLFGSLIVLALANCCSPPCGPTPTYRVPILEMVIQEPFPPHPPNPHRPLLHPFIVPEAPDNSYLISENRELHFHVLGDVNLKVLVDQVALPRRDQSTSTSGWYEPNGTAVSASRSFFWDIAIELPRDVVAKSKTTFPIEFVYDTVTKMTQPELRVTLRLKGHDPTYAIAHPRPSEVFVDSTDNTKNDNRMETSIVAVGVTVAGWLTGPPNSPGRNHGTALPGASEDWHYDINPDPDFIDRNYGTAYAFEPVSGAQLPGNVVPLFPPGMGPIPLVPAGTKVNAGTFLIAGSGILGVELNAWHISKRGPKPSAWVNDPDQTGNADNAWPYDPNKGSNDPSGPDLQIGDYVILSGTLWQDSAHTEGSPDPLHVCLEHHFKGQGGWLELHPVDTVRRVDPPPVRKHVVGFSRCGPDAQSATALLQHPQPPPDKNSQLKFRVVVDSRFTTSGATHSESINPICEPPGLFATVDASASGSYNAAYILWWEEGSSPRTGTAVCLPAASPVLGIADD